MEKNNTFETLYNINLSDKLKEKIGLKYLSWAYAWAELKKLYPEAERIIYKRLVKTTETKTLSLTDGTTQTIVNEYENEIPYFTDGRTCTVKVGVKIDGVEYIEELPVMDNKNKAIRAEVVTSVDINRAIQRAFVKACALHGLGLYVYAGEDLPEADKVVIDYNSLKTNEYKDSLSDAEFAEVQKEVINFVQASQQECEQSVSDQIYTYVTELFPNKRLSLLTNPEDAINLQKLHYFLVHLFAILKK